MEGLRSTQVKRSWSNTFLSLAFAAALFGLGVFAFYQGRIFGPLACFFFGVFGVGAAIFVSYTGTCPACGARQKRLGGLHRCNSCYMYGNVSNGQYRELEPDYVAKTPTLAAPISLESQVPSLCCACGIPATRCFTLRIVRKEFALNLEAPHCELHGGGGVLATETMTAYGNKETPVIKVMSYRFYLEFVRLNGLSTQI